MLSRLMSGKRLLKTPEAFAFGVFICVFYWGSPVFAACPAGHVDETVRVAQVVDGDTLRLQDGRRVRVLGINTPELAHKEQVAQALGAQASAATRAFLSQTRAIHLAYDQERKDRYGRILAHVYNDKRQSLASHLLERGLAFQVVVPPNLSEADCLADQEARARQQRRGLWRDSEWRSRSAADLDLERTGFLRVKGVITKVSVQRDIWLELDGPIVIKISQRDRRYFPRQQWQSWLGEHVELRGWVINRSSDYQRQRGFKPLQLQLRHPLMLEVAPQLE